MFAIGAWGALASCQPMPSEGEQDRQASESSDEGDTFACGTPEDSDIYRVGLWHEGSRVRVAFVDAFPAPPQLYDNTWIISITDLDGVPLNDAGVEVLPSMPIHGHKGSVPSEVRSMEQPGQYQLDPVYLAMAGLWAVELRITETDALAHDTVTFTFCIEP